jgi:hypothetical protein
MFKLCVLVQVLVLVTNVILLSILLWALDTLGKSDSQGQALWYYILFLSLGYGGLKGYKIWADY